MGSLIFSKKKGPPILAGLMARAATYSPGCDPSTIGAAGLNFSVRDGKRWGPCAGPPNVCDPGNGTCTFPASNVLCLEVSCKDYNRKASSVQVFGQLVPLGCAVACFTPAAYRRRRLRRPAWRPHLEVGFALSCFQRLSLPDVANRRCSWHHTPHTSGRSSPVLSY